MHELLGVNYSLKSEKTGLSNELSAKDSQLRKIQTQIDSFTRRMRGEVASGKPAGGGGGSSSGSSCSGESPRHTPFKKSRDLFAEEPDQEAPGGGDGGDLSDEALARSNSQLTAQVRRGGSGVCLSASTLSVCPALPFPVLVWHWVGWRSLFLFHL